MEIEGWSEGSGGGGGGGVESFGAGSGATIVPDFTRER